MKFTRLFVIGLALASAHAIAEGITCEYFEEGEVPSMFAFKLIPNAGGTTYTLSTVRTPTLAKDRAAVTVILDPALECGFSQSLPIATCDSATHKLVMTYNERVSVMKRTKSTHEVRSEFLIADFGRLENWKAGSKSERVQFEFDAGDCERR